MCTYKKTDTRILKRHNLKGNVSSLNLTLTIQIKWLDKEMANGVDKIFWPLCSLCTLHLSLITLEMLLE